MNSQEVGWLLESNQWLLESIRALTAQVERLNANLEQFSPQRAEQFVPRCPGCGGLTYYVGEAQHCVRKVTSACP